MSSWRDEVHNLTMQQHGGSGKTQQSQISNAPSDASAETPREPPKGHIARMKPGTNGWGSKQRRSF